MNRMSEIIITKSNFNNEVLQSDKPVLLDFWASWCTPCRRQGAVISEFARLHPEIKVGKVNVDEQQELAISFQVMSIPTLVVIQKGRIVRQNVGFQSLWDLETMVK